MQNLHLRVCDKCWDIPSEQLRTLILPPDPTPVTDPRTEPYTIDEINHLTLSAIIGKPAMLIAESDMGADLERILGIVTPFSDTGGVTAALQLGAGLTAPFSDADAMTVSLLLGIGLTAPFSDADAVTASLLLGRGLTAPFSDASAMTADVDVQTAAATRTVTDDFEVLASGSHSEAGVAIGTATADRLVVLAISALNTTSSDGFDSVTIGGVSATLAVEVIRTTGVGFSFCSIYWANVTSGTTATIDLTFTGDDIACEVEVYRVVGADTVTPVTDTGTGSVASGNVSDSVTIGNGSVTIAAVQDGVNTGAAGTTAWTNATEDRDGGVDVGGAFVTTSFASRQDATGPGATTITAAVTGEDLDTNKTLAIAVIAP